jgi:cell division protein FtsZ
MNSLNSPTSYPIIKIVGVGGGGGNAVNRMIEGGIKGVEFIAVDTDDQALLASKAGVTLQIGTGGLGTGGNPEMGAMAAHESLDAIREALSGADMVFVVVGEGGGTGTGAAPVVAQVARDDIGAITVGMASLPLSFAGGRRHDTAIKGIVLFEQYVDTIIVIPTDILHIPLAMNSYSQRFGLPIANDRLRQGTQGITDLITSPGEISLLSFDDVQSVLKGAGTAKMGIGMASEENRAKEAATAAVSQQLLEGAQRILMSVAVAPVHSLSDFIDATDIVSEAADPDAQIISGMIIDDTLSDDIRVTVIATGFTDEDAPESAQAKSEKDFLPSFRVSPIHIRRDPDFPDFLKPR